jgi:pimeloyl-ACP methyl ester carboxylesterase
MSRTFLALSVILLSLPGCAEITVSRSDNPDLLNDWRSSLIEPWGLSVRTLQTLRQLDLGHIYRDRPSEAYERLRAFAVEDPQPDRVFALAEICYDLGRRAEQGKKPEAIGYYYLCAGYAYRYLIPSSPPPHPRPLSPRGERGEEISRFDPRFRLACDFYNTSLSKCLRAALKDGKLEAPEFLAIRAAQGAALTMPVERRGFSWRPEEFGPLLFCADYEVVGLPNQYHSYGLGVPLLCERLPAVPALVNAAFPRDLYFPVTAFLQFDGDLANLGIRSNAKLVLCNPLAEQFVRVEHGIIPLESDLTTPLAYSLSRSDLYRLQYEGFLWPDKLQRKTGIYMLEPYQPGKIPVLLVHGLLSSPATWAPMFNDLRADPTICAHFQFWGYLYPTGDPYFLTAADLRQKLAGLRDELDSQHRDPALDDMVCVGHSMGGLISELLTVDSGDSYWQLFSSQPIDQLKLQPDARQTLERVFFFHAEPSVRRVVFLATPHHGSKLSRGTLGKLADTVISIPKSLVRVKDEVSRDNPKIILASHNGNVPTSVDLLEPGSPALELLASQPPAAGVHYHSIIGVLPPQESWLNAITPVSHHGKEPSDGVVPYSSAHLDAVDSEVTVPADHMRVHNHPLAILEVRRILLEHLREAQNPH